MFAQIRRHQKWFFIAALAIIIPSFVIFFTPNVQKTFSGRASTVDYTIGGLKVSQERVEKGQGEAAIFYLLNFGEWPTSGSMAERMGFNLGDQGLRRLIIADEIKKHDIAVTDEAIKKYIQNVMRDSDGNFDPEQYKRFTTQILPQGRLSSDDYFRYVENQIGLGELQIAYGLSGQLIPPDMVKSEFLKENERVKTEAVFFYTSNFLSEVIMDTNSASVFYTNNMSMYRVPEQRQVSYAAFYATNHYAQADEEIAKMTNLVAEIDSEYKSRGADSFKDDGGNVLSAEAAKEKIRKDRREFEALRFARIQANELASKMFDQFAENQNRTETNFVNFLQGEGVTVVVSEPFERFKGPEDFDGGSQIGQAASRLSVTNRFNFDVVAGDKTAYLIALNKIIPSRQQTFEEVADKAESDYKNRQAAAQMRLTARRMYGSVTNGIAEGATFKVACQTNNLEVIEMPAFSKQDNEVEEVAKHVSFFGYKNQAFELADDAVSTVQSSGDTAYFMHSLGHLPADPAFVEEKFPEELESRRNRFEGQAFQAWITQQIDAASPGITTTTGQ